jgi:hypothetical protein
MGNIIQQFNQYKVVNANNAELVRQSIYDFQSWGASGVGSTIYTFFSAPVGQNGKTYADTNMETANMLPRGVAMLVESIEVVFFSAASIDAVGSTDVPGTSLFAEDEFSFRTSRCWLEFKIAEKSFLKEAPMSRFPMKTHFEAELSSAMDTGVTSEHGTIVSSVGSWRGRPYFLEPKVVLESNYSFQITLNFPTAVTLPSATNARFGVIVDGQRLRVAQ